MTWPSVILPRTALLLRLIQSISSHTHRIHFSQGRQPSGLARRPHQRTSLGLKSFLERGAVGAAAGRGAGVGAASEVRGRRERRVCEGGAGSFSVTIKKM